MKINKYYNNKYFWLKINNSLIVKQRLLNRTAALFISCIYTPGSLFVFYLLYNNPKAFFDGSSASLIIVFFTICFIISLFSILSLFWIPNKAIFTEEYLIYYPYAYVPLGKLIIKKHDIISINFIANKYKVNVLGAPWEDTDSKLVLNLSNKQITLLTIHSKYILEHFKELLNEINIMISK